jgi:hypothetical protein
MLAGDPDARHKYIEAVTNCIAPCVLKATDIFLEHKHLMVDPG